MQSVIVVKIHFQISYHLDVKSFCFNLKNYFRTVILEPLAASFVPSFLPFFIIIITIHMSSPQNLSWNFLIRMIEHK